MSANLIKSSCYNLDGSHSISLFLEKNPIVGQGWAFVAAYMMLNGSYKEVGLHFFHGRLIGWYGRPIRHCTAAEKVGKD